MVRDDNDWQVMLNDEKSRKQDKECAVVTPEVEAAFEVGDRVTAQETKLSKRRTMHNSWDRVPIDGCNIEMSNVLRDVVALHFGGNALREAFKKVAGDRDIIPNTVEKYYYRNKDAVTLVEEEHLTRTIKEYHKNLWAVRSMMSEAGPKAIKVIIGVMNNRDSSPNVKLKAAQTILKMMDIDGSASGNSNESVAKESLRLVRDVISNREKGQDTYVLPAKAEDLEEEDESEDRTSDCM